MRRPFVTSIGALALALLPAALYAQTPPAAPPQQPPAGQPPAGQAPPAQAPAQPEKPALTFKSNAGLLLIQVKADQTAVFEEMFTKLRAAMATTQNAEMKAAASAIRVYRAAEPMDGNPLYVMVVDPTTPGTEAWPLGLLAKMLSDDDRRKPETADMFKRYQDAIAKVAGQLNLTMVEGK
jgi:hypothetical protein